MQNATAEPPATNTVSRRVIFSGAAAFLVVMGTLELLAVTENGRFWLLYATIVTTAIASAITFATRRLLFSAAVTLLLLAGILLVSRVKLATMTMSLHAYDIFFYADTATFSFLWSGYRGYIVAAIAFVAFGLIVAALTWRLDALRCPRVFSLSVLVLMTACVAQFDMQPNSLVFELFERQHANASTFYRTWRTAFDTIVHGQRFSTARTTLPPFAPQSPCAPSPKPPNILLIHQESLVEPSLFPALDYNHDLDRFFLSDDHRLHKLRVEIYGGASWITDFSLMTGVSARFFGTMRLFVQVLMTGRLGETLPQVLKTCG